jgi:hypothetical protein
MIPFLLWALATLDTAFAGYREAAGRSALIEKRAYYRRAMLRGAIFGQMAAAAAGAFIGAFYLISSDPARLLNDLHRAGWRMLCVYLPYAGVTLAAFLVRLVPSVDLRSLTSVLVFGPFTLIRPAVAIAGGIWAVAAAPRAEVLFLVLLVLALMLSSERIIGKLRGRVL